MADRNRRLAPAGRVIAGVAAGVAIMGAGVLLAGAVVAAIFARAVVTPPTKRDQDVRIIRADKHSVTLSATIDAMTPGRYSLWFADDTGHARIGEILSYTDNSVTRELLDVEMGQPEGGTRGRFSGWFYLRPEEFGLPFTDVEIATDLGPAPAWSIPAEAETGLWMIGVHGRAVHREETLRSVPVFRAAGYSCLLISYRNDGDAPASPDNRYGLGDTEWRDVESAIRFAVDHGARRVVLMGWSMGGAIVLQALTRTSLPEAIVGVVLESPVVDWVTALNYQAVAYRLPRPVRLLIPQLLARRWARLLIGQETPIDLGRMDLVTRAGELHTPILLMHSDDDGYVPSTASRALARARPDIVTFEAFFTARHTRLWNFDSERWNGAITRWLESLR